jgi:hypothetical protein
VGSRRSVELGDSESAHWTRQGQEGEKEGWIEEGGKGRAPPSKYTTLKLAWERRIFILKSRVRVEIAIYGKRAWTRATSKPLLHSFVHQGSAASEVVVTAQPGPL